MQFLFKHKAVKTQLLTGEAARMCVRVLKKENPIDVYLNQIYIFLKHLQRQPILNQPVVTKM